MKLLENAVAKPSTPKPRAGLRAVPRVVWALGAVSLLTDTASDLVYPLIPALLGAAGGGAMALGVLEGVAELVSTVAKIWGGRVADRARRPGLLVVAGYGIAAVARPFLAVISAPWQAVLARAIDRTGKGIRSAPRDAILAASATESRGLAFGVHRAMDNLGGVFGASLAFLLLQIAGWSVRSVVLFSIVPGALSTALAWRSVGRARAASAAHVDEVVEPSSTSVRALPSDVAALVACTALFALGAAADSFLLIRLRDLGVRTALLPIAWLSLQLAKVLFNVPGGALADRVGPKRVLIASWSVYALAYALFARAATWPQFWALFLLYALHYGLGEGAEKSLMARLAPQASSGLAFGWQNAAHGVALLPANLLFGALYVGHPARAFSIAASFAVVAALALWLFVPETPLDRRLTSSA